VGNARNNKGLCLCLVGAWDLLFIEDGEDPKKSMHLPGLIMSSALAVEEVEDFVEDNTMA
jgi:hypothetical protein